ncbi:MAG: hypothetical protein PHV23_03005 [Candidatus Gracilibacteria bacterium]|nr:hypothetical protein [Candidatus Gracilibacteria bacterium]
MQLKETRENTYSNKLDDIISTQITKIEKEDKEEKEKGRTKNEKKNDTNLYYYQKNHLNSIIAITDKKGNIVEEYSYDVFGKAYILEGKSENRKDLKESKIGNTRLYTGREYDSEIGLYYNRARYYNPELGRFISRDPIDIYDDVNLYGYVKNNSVNAKDPTGLKSKSFIAENEGNAWFFESQNGIHTGHAAMYFINGGVEYLINYNPTGSEGFNPLGDGDMFFGTVGGTN